VEVPGLAELKNALQGLLEGTDITVEDVRSAVALPAATAKGQTGALSQNLGGGVVISSVRPLPDADDVRHLEKRLESVEAWLQETNEKLDRVLAALSAKEHGKVVGFTGDANSSRFVAFATCCVVAGLLHDSSRSLGAGVGRGAGRVRRPRGGPVRHPSVPG
jgi:hypothetical protein